MSVRSRIWWVLTVGGFLLLAPGVALALDARHADHALHRAEQRLTALQKALADGDDQRAAQLLRQLQADAASAEAATRGPVWRAAGAVPLAGRSAAQAAVVTRSVRELADEALPGLLLATQVVRPVVHGGGEQVDLAALRRAAPFLDSALQRVSSVDDDLSALPSGLVLPRVASARNRLAAKVHRLASTLADADAAMHVAPAMLGADGPRRYFVAFQNNAESRGTGGLVGAYAILLADHGRISVLRVGSDLELTRLPAPRVDLGVDYRRLYGQDTHIIQNTNMSGNYPYAAAQWLDMWWRGTGQHLDGALATDPIALSYLLGSTGPVALPRGGTVTTENVVAETEQRSYVRYAANDAARKLYLMGVAHAVLDRVLGPAAPARTELLKAVAHAASQRRFLVYSAHPQEQAWLDGTSVSGEVPEQLGPFAYVVVNNTAGNKIDYFLSRRLQYDVGPCRAGRRESLLSVTLRNGVPAEPLPRFIVGRVDRKGPVGSTSLLVSTYLAWGATVRSATLDGRPVPFFAGAERGHPVVLVRVELPRGVPQSLVLHVSEPGVDSAPLVLQQPLVRPQVTDVHVASC